MTGFLVVVGALCALGAFGVVLSPKPIYSALSLVWSIGMLAVIYLALNAQFLFAVQLIVYAGAVMVLFVFIIALLSPSSEDRVGGDLRTVLGFAAVIAITAAFVVVARNNTTYDTTSAASGTAQQNQAFHGYVAGGGGTTDPTLNPYHTFVYDQGSVDAEGAGNVQTVGGQLFTTFLLPFEITSLLLLVAAVGAVYLTRRTPTTA